MQKIILENEHSGMLRKKLLAAGVAAAVSLASVGSLASGEETGTGSEKEESSKETKEIEEIVVTGTVLRNVYPTSPVTTITREDIDKLGVHSAEDIVRSLPQNFSSLNAASSLTNTLQETWTSSQDFGGSSAANLRGMGIDATLVLVNGRRVAASPLWQGNFVSLSNLPANAIERVEILNDGASSIYGADAIGGVINFILKKNFAGSETSVRHENSSNGGDVTSISQLFGFGWDSGQATITLSHQKTDPVSSAKAGWTTSDLRSRGGTDNRNTITGSPGTINVWVDTDEPPYYGYYERQALPADSDGTDWTPEDFSGENVIPGEMSRNNLTSENERSSAYISLEQEVTDTLQAFLDISYTRNANYSEGGVFNLRQWVGPDNVYNHFDEYVLLSYNFKKETEDGILPYNNYTNEREQRDYTLGFDWDLPFRDWRLKTTAGFGRSLSSSDAVWFNRNSLELTELLRGIRYTISETTGRPIPLLDENGETIPVPASEQVNLFGNGTVQSSRLAEFVEPRVTGAPESIQKNVSALLEGGLMDLPGGELRLALGTEVRKDIFKYSEDSTRQYNDGDGVEEPERTVEAAFFEASVPVFGSENRIDGFESLLFSIGARWENYDIPDAADGTGTSFSNVSPKAGFAWEPIQDLRVRGTWSESFRAPNFSEVMSPRELGWYETTEVFDVLAPGGAEWVEVPYYNGGNKDLKPETSTSTTLGFDWTPASLEGLTVSMTLSKIEFVDRIDSLSLSGNLPLEVVLANTDFAVRNSDGTLKEMNFIPINVSGRESESIDFDIRYEFDSEYGLFDARIGGTYTGLLEDVVSDGAESIKMDGTINGPDQWRARASLGWTGGNMGANLFVNYSSSYMNVNDPTRFYLQTDDVDPVPVDHYTTVDLTGYYRMPESGWEVLVGVRNLFQKGYPFVNNAGGTPFDFARIDTRGRVIYLEVKKSFEF